MKELYWKYMVQVKAWEFYLEAYTERSYRWDKAINIFTAAASSSSIAAWTVWQQFSCVWAGIIAAAQLATAVKSFLPFSERLKTLPALKGDIASLYNEIEANWYKVSSVETEQEIHDRIYQYKGRLTEIENNYLREMVLPERLDIQKAADKKAEEYFQLYFPESENHLKNNLAGSIQIPVLTGLPAMSVQIRCPEQASALHGANRM